MKKTQESIYSTETKVIYCAAQEAAKIIDHVRAKTQWLCDDADSLEREELELMATQLEKARSLIKTYLKGE